MLLLLDNDGGCPIARPARPWDRLLAHLRADRLDRDLASGACPDATVELALRAQMLVRASVRRDLARSAQRVLAAATQPAASRRPAVPVCRDRVRYAAAEFGELIRRLGVPGPVPARGVAQASLLLGDATGPLYHRGNREDLRARVREATDALRPLSNW
jgi:hypothetical protein